MGKSQLTVGSPFNMPEEITYRFAPQSVQKVLQQLSIIHPSLHVREAISSGLEGRVGRHYYSPTVKQILPPNNHEFQQELGYLGEKQDKIFPHFHPGSSVVPVQGQQAFRGGEQHYHACITRWNRLQGQAKQFACFPFITMPTHPHAARNQLTSYQFTNFKSHPLNLSQAEYTCQASGRNLVTP